MANVPTIASTNRATVPGIGALANQPVKAGDFNPLVDRVNSIASDANTISATTGTITTLATTTPTVTKGTVTQATSITTGVTVNASAGVITTVALTTAAGAQESPFVVTNSAVATTSVVILTTEYANGKTGTPIAIAEAVSAGSFSVRILNGKASGALNDVVKVHFLIV